jgi:hypothetical protein
MMRLLLDHGADINIFRGCNALHYAAGYGNVEAVEVAIEKGASVASEDVFGMTALDWAMLNKTYPLEEIDAGRPLCPNFIEVFVAIAAACLVDVEGFTGRLGIHKLHLYVALGDMSLINSCANEVSVKANADNLLSPLHVAAASGSIEVVRVLVSYGGDVTAKSRWGRTSFDYACVSGHKEVAAFLVAVEKTAKALAHSEMLYRLHRSGKKHEMEVSSISQERKTIQMKAELLIHGSSEVFEEEEQEEESFLSWVMNSFAWS